ncbi:MAG TPA: DUF1028 domain-containing protein [Planctomycetota bacterium]|nr:DUF1028 domain-containing protein [Planctomycetota bacterium]
MKITSHLGRVSRWRAALAGLVVLTLASTAGATWSIIAVNTRTKEICVSSATCLANFDLRLFLPVVVVGRGAGCAQSFVDNSGLNRQAIFNGLIAGHSPAQILQVLQQIDPSFQTRQYGIVDMFNAPVTFTGSGAGVAKFGVTGINGEIRYAIQGNVLTGNQVVTDAETAFLASTGDLSTRVILAMEAARALGGDGRCSCNPNAPTSCGVPPPNFVKSAHVGFMIDARLGDTDGVCNASVGCATGSYYFNFNVIGGVNSQDPVIQLGTQYQAWRTQQLGHPDGLNSLVFPGAQTLPADGHTATSVDFTLLDIEGLPITQGGATVTLTNVSGAPAVTTPSAVIDHGNGTYSFTLTAGLTQGEDQWKITVNDGVRPATLAPYLRMRVDPAFDLHCGFDEVSISRDTLVPFTFNLGPQAAGRRYWLLCSAHGTQPGTVFQGVPMPLNMDPFFVMSVRRGNTAVLPHSKALLDANGYAQAGFQTWQSNFTPLLGGRVDFSAIVFFGPNPVPTSGAGFDVMP